MLRVIDLLRLPSLSEAYVAAGGKGIFNVIHKFEVLEETYPSVVRFLTEHTVYLTNFWSLAEDKESRIRLIEEMISHHCAGIGIMPGVHLDNVIDPEILQLANEKSFPIIYIPESVRWGHLISEYSIVSSRNVDDFENNWMKPVLDLFTGFHVKEDPNVFCRKLGEMLNLPIIIATVTVYSYGAEGINVALFISKIQKILQSGRETVQSPMMVRVDNSHVAVVYLGKSSIIACCVAHMEMRDNALQLYHQVAPFAVCELDRITGKVYPTREKVNLRFYANKRMYIAFLLGENYRKCENQRSRNYIVYESSSYQKYCILLIPEKEEKNFSVYEAYCEIFHIVEPELFVFSQSKYNQRQVLQEISHMKDLLHSLLYLKGIYSMDELPLIYIMSNMPYEYDARLFSAKTTAEMSAADVITFLHTLRLYLVLRNITDVSKLMGIHVNSVKYRLMKALQYMGIDEDIQLNELPFVQLLVILEHFIADNK